MRVGDLIKVYQNQEIPADVLILDIQGSKGNQTCLNRGGIWDKFSDPVIKSSYPGTANKTGFHISDEKFISSISGTLKWDYNHQGFFTGSFKQENTATAIEISMENMLTRGCYFSKASQVIGIVLNVGRRTMESGEALRNPHFEDLIAQFKDVKNLGKSSVQGRRNTINVQIWFIGMFICLLPPVSLFMLEILWQSNPPFRFFNSQFGFVD